MLSSALTTLPEYRDDQDDPVYGDTSLDDSGVLSEGENDSDGGDANCEDVTTETHAVLREKIATLEKENNELKVQLKNIYALAGE